MKLIEKYTELSQEAIGVIKAKLQDCAGNFVWFDQESAFDEEDTNELTAEFLKVTHEFTADSQWDTNETCYLLKIVDAKHDAEVWGITETGEVVVTRLLDMELHQICDLGDFILGINS